MGVISDVLNHITAECRPKDLLRVRVPWSLENEKSDMPILHLVTEGCMSVLSNGETIHLNSGDMILLPNGRSHVLSNAPETPVADLAEQGISVRQRALTCGVVRDISGGHSGSETSKISAYVDFLNCAASHLIWHLPDKLIIKDVRCQTGRRLEPLIHLCIEDAHAGEPGAMVELNGLMRLVFLHFMRLWLTSGAPKSFGWINGLKDPRIAKTISLIHQEPARNWSVEELAAEVGMSRSSFAARFMKVTQEPPLKYLTRWRMTMAAQMLRAEPHRTIYDIGFAAGYASEGSFSSAFRRHFGETPGAWRKRGALSATDHSHGNSDGDDLQGKTGQGQPSSDWAGLGVA